MDEIIEAMHEHFVTHDTKRAVTALAAAFGLAGERPTIAQCVSVANAFGARPEPVCAAWGYLHSADNLRRHVWVDVEGHTAGRGLVPDDDAEVAACFAIYRGLRGARVVSRVVAGR
jgi:hypothetical protein